MARPRNPHPFRVPVVRHVDAEGHRCAAGDPGAVRHKGLSASYYADLYPGGKRRRYALKTTDLGQAWVRLRQLQKEVEDEDRGITDPYTRHAGTLLDVHLDNWEHALADEGKDAGRVALIGARVRKLVAEAGWKRLTDVTAPDCRAALGRLGQTTTERRGLSAQTRNHYLGHLKQFLAWCVASRRLRDNPLTGAKPVDVSADRRHDRRSPTDLEVGHLFAHLDAEAPTRNDMTGPQRRLGYAVAMATGLRAGELRSLTRESFDLDGGAVTVEAAYDKRGRQAVQPLPPWLLAELRAWFAAGGGCWSRFPAKHPGRLLKDDLAAAGVPYQTPAGFFDFHALRHWYCTQVGSQPGMDLKTLLTLTRHSTAELALKRYAKIQTDRVRTAADQVPQPKPVDPPRG